MQPRHIFRATMLSLATVVFLGLAGCSSGGGGGSGGTTGATTSSGSSSKGPFKQGSTVVAYKLNTDGTRDINQTTLTTDGKGHFSFASLPWSGPTEFVISGEYLNENTGTYMTLAPADGISAVTNVTAGTSTGVNINLFTNIAAKNIIASMAAGSDITTAKQNAEESVKQLFNINLPAGTSLDDLDPTDASTNTQANTQLLLVSSALLNTPNPEQAMAQLADDMSDGEIDGEAVAALEDVKAEVSNVNIAQVAANMESADIGVTNPPDDATSALNGLLAFDNNISFTPKYDVFKDTSYVSNEVTVDGIYGGSGAISISSNGEYSINGAAWTSAAGTVTNGQKVKVRVTSASAYSTQATATLTIGGAQKPFSVITQDDPFVADTSPAAFDFGYIANQLKTATNVTSSAVTITGINTATPISVTGGSYSINGAGYVTGTGNVNNDDNVTVRGDANATGGGLTTVTLTVGDKTGAFKIFTAADDTTPDAFSFDAAVDVNKTANPTVDSNSITITGINTATPISVSGGEMSVNGGGFTTTAATTVSNGQSVVLRGVPSDTFATTTTATLTVGNVVGSFDITTMADPFVADTTPNALPSLIKVDQNTSDTVTTPSFDISGINTPTQISIVNGSYSINGGGFVSTDGNVSNGDTIQVQQTTAATFDTAKVTTLTVGGVSATFKTVTKVEDAIPDTFGFDINASVTVGDTNVVSNTVTISGINTDLNISVLNGEYEINGGGFTATAGTVTNGDTVTLRQPTVATTAETANVTTLTVGNIATTFTTVTLPAAPAINTATAAPTTVNEDAVYTFTPELNATSGSADSWSITNKPTWATFNTVNGKLEGTPTNSDVGTSANITITAINSQGSDSYGPFDITIANTNDAPTATDVNATTNEDMPVDINVSSAINDVDVGDVVSVSSLGTASLGSVSNVGNVITYTPVLNAFGTDSFTYTVTDTNGSTATATVHVTIAAQNDAPVAQADAAVTNEDVNLSIPFATLLANDSDVDSNITVSAVTNGTNGTASIVGSDVVYVPNANFNGTDLITYTVSDGSLTADANVTISVNAVNDPATISGTLTGNVVEDTTLSTTGTLTVTDNDTNETTVVPLTSIAGTYGTFNLDANGSWSYALNNAAANVQALAQDVNATDSFSVTSTDGTDTKTITLTVTGVNDVAVLGGNLTGNAVEDTAMSISGVISVDDNDTNQSTLVPQVDVNATYGVFNVAANGSWTYVVTDTPTIQALAQGEVVYDLLTDVNSTDGSASTDINVTITGTNDAPVAVAHTPLQIKKETVLSFTVTATDIDNGAVVTLSHVTSNQATAVISFDANGSVDFNASTAGSYVLAYTFSDEHNTTSSADVTITVNNSDAPVAAPDTITIDEDTNATIDILANDSDDQTALKDLNVSIETAPAHGQVQVNHYVDANDTITYVPAANYNGSDVFSYKITDADGGTSVADVNITINPVNDTPVIVPDTFNAVASQTNTVNWNIWVNDIDVDEDTLSVSSCDATSTLGATVTLTGNTILAYTVGDVNGTDTFDCNVTDGTVTVTETVTVNVLNNHAPIAASTALTMVVGDTLTGQIPAYDPDGESLTFTAVAVSPEVSGAGTTLTTDGNFSITAHSVGQGYIDINITDGGNGDVNATLTTSIRYDINVISQVSTTDTYSLSEAGDITSGEFDTYVAGTHPAMPADQKLYDFWGTENNGTLLQYGYLKFDSNGTFEMLDNNQTNFASHDVNLSGVVQVSMTDPVATGFDPNNVFAQVVMIDDNVSASEINTSLPFVANLQMPASAVVYKTAVRMMQDKYNVWGPAEDCKIAGCPQYSTLSAMIDNNATGIVGYAKSNNKRVFVFAPDSNLSDGSGTVVEVDMTDVYQNGGQPYVINPNAGTWSSATSYTDENNASIPMVIVTYAAGVDSWDPNTILVDAGAVIDGNTTTGVMKGSYDPAGSAFVEYRFNDVAAAVILNNFYGVTPAEWATKIQGSYPDSNVTAYDATPAIQDPQTVVPLYELESRFNGVTYDLELTKYDLDGISTATMNFYINGVLDTNASGTFAYTYDSTTGVVTLNDPTIPADIYEFKITGIASQTDLATSFGLYIPESAKVYEVMGKQLVDAPNYYAPAVSISDANGTIDTGSFSSIGGFVANTRPQQLSGFASRYDGATGESYILTFETNTSNADTVGATGNLMEVNATAGYDAASAVIAGTWETIFANGESTLVIHPTNPAYNDRMCFGMDSGLQLLAGNIDRVNDVNVFYVADSLANDVIGANFANQGVNPSSPIVGVWQIGSTNTDFDYLAILPNGEFMLGEYDSTVVEPQNGLEVGTYTYDGTNVTLNITYDKNAPGTDSGIGDVGTPVTMPVTVSADGITLTITTPVGPLVWSRADTTSNPMLGVWRNGSATTDFSYMVLLGDYTFMYGEYDSTVVDPVAENGLEAGTYTYNGTDATFTILYDENYPGNNSGIGDIGTPATLNVSLSADGTTLSGPITWTKAY